MDSAYYAANILEETSRQEEKKIIAAAAQVGCISNVEVHVKGKTNLERSDNPEATSCLRRLKALTQAINRRRLKVLGHWGVISKNAVDIMEHLPGKFKKTSIGSPVLHCMDYTVSMEPPKTKLMMIFIWV
jgi:hypothetical protein